MTLAAKQLESSCWYKACINLDGLEENSLISFTVGTPGHLKERSLKDQMAKDPTEVIRKAVLRMLPRNELPDDRDRKLRIFSGGEHPFGDKPLEPFVMPPRQVR
ncbi:putative ribosomal protein L13 [Helianthus annuus]|uniref:Ribosomal protein L13 n=1 Tax=Helianthus annuus TaxID=4232 RepID=A0A9K3GU05_HELAN|nr:putative ribosomal protein L13 [Helianthus annuus]KAJ0812951.1 putative ribosomal protein L13 [Helianthus annuus]